MWMDAEKLRDFGAVASKWGITTDELIANLVTVANAILQRYSTDIP
jgi:hypothetical protein